MRGFLVLLAVVAGLLAFTNPTMDDFRPFVEERSEELLQREIGDGPLGEALSGLGAQIAGAIVERMTERENYFVVSTYTLYVGDERRPENAWKFLGIAGTFVEMDRPDQMEARQQDGR